MPEPHKRIYRHPKYKTAYRVHNWPEYDTSLCNRGDLTLWISHEAIDTWTPPPNGKRGAQPRYADIAIETALSLRLLFHLPLRQSEGFLRSILQLMRLDLPCPDHTTLSRRNATVAITQPVRDVSGSPTDLIVDSTGLTVCGQGAWHRQTHGEQKCQRWRKRHIGVDHEGWVLAQVVTDSHEHDPSQVPALLGQVDGPISRFVADGIYDQEPVYDAVERHSPGAWVIIPPRKDAVVSLTATIAPSQRDQHLLAIERTNRFQWKQLSGYDDQAHAENAFSRCKRACGGRLRAKRDEAQEREAALACQVLNRMWELGRPQSYLIS